MLNRIKMIMRYMWNKTNMTPLKELTILMCSMATFSFHEKQIKIMFIIAKLIPRTSLTRIILQILVNQADTKKPAQLIES